MYKQVLLAHWCYSKNFGDALNPYLLSKLTGLKVVYCNLEKPHLLKEFVSMLRHIKHRKKY